MKGHRLPDGSVLDRFGNLLGEWPKPGAYWRNPDGAWYGMVPAGRYGLIANFSGHTVEEHADGSITVQPSVRVHGMVSLGPCPRCGGDSTGDKKGDPRCQMCSGAGEEFAIEDWHGYLTRGEWHKIDD